MTDAKHPRQRTETQRVNRRLRTLERRVAYLAATMADPVRFSGLSDVARHHVVAEHNAIVWALGFLMRNRKAVFDEAMQMDIEAGRAWWPESRPRDAKELDAAPLAP